MNTNYGKIPTRVVTSSLKRLTGKVFKILPMREEGCDTLDSYVENLLRELINTKSLVLELQDDGEFLSLLSTLKGLADNDIDVDVCRSDVFKCTNIIDKMIDNLKRKG